MLLKLIQQHCQVDLAWKLKDTGTMVKEGKLGGSEDYRGRTALEALKQAIVQ